MIIKFLEIENLEEFIEELASSFLKILKKEMRVRLNLRVRNKPMNLFHGKVS